MLFAIAAVVASWLVPPTHFRPDLSAGVLMPAQGDPALSCLARRLLFASRKALRIACFGTSVTAGARERAGSIQRRLHYPSVLQQLLRKRFPRANVTVGSYGYAGASAEYLHACMDRTHA